MVNLVQRSDSSTDGHDGEGIREHMPGNPDAEEGLSFVCQQGTKGEKVRLEADSDSDSSFDERTLLVGSDGRLLEFVDAEFEDLVSKEGPLQILQLTIQNETDNLLKEEITDADDYTDWIRWVAEEERRMQSLVEATSVAEESVLLQIQQMDIVDCSGDVEERITRNPKENTRWGEIC